MSKFNSIKEFKNNEINFKQLIDEYKNTKDRCNKPCLYEVLRNEKLFEELIENNKLTLNDLKYLLNTIDNDYELSELTKNTFLLMLMIYNKIVSFQELIDKYKSMRCLDTLLDNEYLFEKSIENSKLTLDDLKYLLTRLDNDQELYNLCSNTPLIKYILNEFLLDKKIVDRINTILEKNDEEDNVHTIFELIGYWNKNNEEVLKLNELNRYTCNFESNQNLELIEILKDNEIALNRLKEIVENHLEFNYDFDSLMSYLKKVEKKSILSI